MHYYEGHASAGLRSCQVVGLTCLRTYGKTFNGSGQNKWFTDVVLCHFPCGMVERMTRSFFHYRKCHCPS